MSFHSLRVDTFSLQPALSNQSLYLLTRYGFPWEFIFYTFLCVSTIRTYSALQIQISCLYVIFNIFPGEVQHLVEDSN